MRPTVIALAGLVLLAGTAAAQRLPRIGDIVRIETEGRDTVIGVVVPGPPGLLHVRRADWEVLSVARPLVSSISTYGPQWAKGAKRGALVGGLIGAAALGAAVYMDLSVEGECICIPVSFIVAPVAVGLPVLGAGFGLAFAPLGWSKPTVY